MTVREGGVDVVVIVLVTGLVVIVSVPEVHDAVTRRYFRLEKLTRFTKYIPTGPGDMVTSTSV